MKLFKTILVSLLLSMTAFIPLASAASETILPELDPNNTDWPCDPEDTVKFQEFKDQTEAGAEAFALKIENSGLDGTKDFFACAVKTGYIKMWMLPFFIAWILEFIINLAGLISILMIMIGAYYYIAGGLTDDKEKGKTIIKYAIGGLVLTMLSWVIVQVLLLAVTG